MLSQVPVYLTLHRCKPTVAKHRDAINRRHLPRWWAPSLPVSRPLGNHPCNIDIVAVSSLHLSPSLPQTHVNQPVWPSIVNIVSSVLYTPLFLTHTMHPRPDHALRPQPPSTRRILSVNHPSVVSISPKYLGSHPLSPAPLPSPSPFYRHRLAPLPLAETPLRHIDAQYRWVPPAPAPQDAQLGRPRRYVPKPVVSLFHKVALSISVRTLPSPSRTSTLSA